MTEMTMLDLSKIDLEELAEALEDHTWEAQWYLHKVTGDVIRVSELSEPDEELSELLEGDDLRRIEPLPSSESYGDMEDFVSRVPDPRARDLLARALGGRGAFRRFKDTLFEYPELREMWFRFHDARMRARALRWLADEGLVADDRVQAALRAVEEPDLPAREDVVDPDAVARAVAVDLAELYGERFRGVVLFGSRARGDADPESDLDLLVLLDRVESPWREAQRMSAILWRHTLRCGVAVIEIPVAEDDFLRPATPLLRSAAAEGRRVR